MEFTLSYWLISMLPVIVLLLFISYWRISSQISAVISLVLAAALAYGVFQLEPAHMLLSAGKGAFLSLYVILILLGGILIFKVVDKAGGFNSLEAYITELGGDSTVKLLGLSWALSGFIQGITGFGMPVAIVGAMLTGIGYKPLIALTTVLIGHSWAISFGSMGSSFYALQLVTGLPAVRLATVMALLFFMPIFTTGLFTVHVYGGFPAIKRELKYIIPATLIMGSMKVFAAVMGFPHIGSLLAGLCGSAFFLGVLLYRTNEGIDMPAKMMSLRAALFPYILLILSVLTAQLPPVDALLPDWEISLSFPGFTSGLGYEVAAEPEFSPIGIFSHPFTFLLVATFIGIIFYLFKGELEKENVTSIFTEGIIQARSSMITVFLLMILAQLMNDSGMIYMFAQGMAAFSGGFFPVLSPVIGILGAFLTGSNTSSNVLFGPFQVDTAVILNYSEYMIASTQSIGGSLGSAIAPAKILMGTAIVGVGGKEGELIKKGLGYTLTSGLLAGFVVLLLAQIL